MKYFKFTEPYFALIKAESEENAVKEYVDEVCDLDDEASEPIEINEEEAATLIGKAVCEDGIPITSEEIAEIINSDTEEVLLVDGSLC